MYVVLFQNGKYWTAERVQNNKPTEDKLFIKGKIESGGLENQNNSLSYGNFNNSRIHIVYGIEQYFIPEGKGQNFSFWDKEVAALVAVDDDGNAVLKKIYVDDKPWP